MNIASYRLQDENLIPFYIIDDRLKQNVQKNNQFFTDCINYQMQMKNQIASINLAQQKLQRQTNEKLIQIEKKIYKEISAQLEGKIAIILGKRMAGILQASQKRESAMNNLEANMDAKLDKISKSLKYEISQDNQKFFMKQMKKLKQNGGLSSVGVANDSDAEPGMSFVSQPQTNSYQKLKRQQKMKQAQQRSQQGSAQLDWQEGHRMVKQLQTRIGKIQQFNIGFDKRFYDSMNSLKESWKQLGGELLDNKKTVNKKLDDLKIEFIKIKNTKDFANTPQKAQETFKAKLAEKFSDIYQLLAESVNKHQFETSIDALTKKAQRHNSQLSEIRQQLAENSQFFTFYMNNADNDDLKGEIVTMGQMIAKNKLNFDEQLKKLKEDNEKQELKVQKLRKLIEDLKEVEIAMDARITNFNSAMDQMINRIDELQDYNKFGPAKMSKISTVLDNDMTVEQRELIDKKSSSVSIQPQNTNQALAREFRSQITKLKDQIFVLNTLSKEKQNQLAQNKKMMSNLQLKIDRIKFEAEQAVISRKPWVCLSCDKQQKQTKKQSKQKKIEPIRAGGYGLQAPLNRNSEKNIASSKSIHAPAFEEKFQVYEKFRQKYLSDAVKLPDIYKQKFGEKGQKDSSKIYD